MPVELTKPELQRFISEQVSAGNFPSPEAVVEAAIEQMILDRQQLRLADEDVEEINRLKIFPHRTVVEDQDPRLKHPIRSLPVESYVIFFRVIEEHAVVRILRVRMGRSVAPNVSDRAFVRKKIPPSITSTGFIF